jgi:hypothetical protein
MATKHLNFLAITLVIVIIKVKIIFKKRYGVGPVLHGAGPPQVIIVCGLPSERHGVERRHGSRARTSISATRSSGTK